jgi:phage baseplate assembly protein W
MSRHLALPLRIVGGRYATVTQGSLADVTQSVRMLVDTRAGERLSIPGYGLADPTFAGLDDAALLDSIAAHEPRADVDITTQRAADGIEQTGVTVRLKGTS